MRVDTLLERLLHSARAADFRAEIFATEGEFGLPALTRSAMSGPDAPHLYLSAGMHGDEPAGPLALLEALRKDRFSRELAWTLVPVLNPTGLALRRRENSEGVDPNRDYGAAPRSVVSRAHLAWLGERRFDVALCLHEDYETEGAYLYELGPPGPSHAPRLLDAMRPWTGIETRPLIDEMPNEEGLMRPPPERLARDREDLPEALRLCFHHTRWCYTTETPSQADITRRIGAQLAVVDALTHLALQGAFRAPADSPNS
ncbi:MAG: M14 family metallocarboxypeptidase [Opitutales bacterium]